LSRAIFVKLLGSYPPAAPLRSETTAAQSQVLQI
jgi:hypothetical protein